MRAWVFTVVAFFAAYIFMFGFAHVRADTRPCVAQLPDPLYPLIDRDNRWYFVSHTVYYWFTALGSLALIWRAYRGDHRPLARFGAALALQAVFRSTTILLLPLCKATVAPGQIPLAQTPTLDLGFAQIPWLMWATNDLVFSGHVGEFLLMWWVTRHWPRPARAALLIFQVLQAYALVATRGHYTIDVLLAIPCAFLALAVADALLRLLSRPQRLPRPI